jgi:hypothetical protein
MAVAQTRKVDVNPVTDAASPYAPSLETAQDLQPRSVFLVARSDLQFGLATAPAQIDRLADRRITRVVRASHRCSMNLTLEPTEVDKSFAQRWLQASFVFLQQSPFRFATLIGLLGWLNTSAVYLADGMLVEKVGVDRLGTVMLPFFWVIASAVARGADDNRLTRQRDCNGKCYPPFASL